MYTSTRIGLEHGFSGLDADMAVVVVQEKVLERRERVDRFKYYVPRDGWLTSARVGAAANKQLH